MRSVAAGSFERLSRPESLWAAWKKCRHGKRRQPRIAAFDLDADRHIFQLHRELCHDTYRVQPCRLSVVHEPKTRVVAAPEVVDRVLHQALLTEIGPTYERGFIDHSFACCTGRGTHRAVLLLLTWMRRYRYRLSLDIRRYFLSIHRPTLRGLFFHRLRDKRTRHLVAHLLTAGAEVYRQPLAIKTLALHSEPLEPDCGIPLGGYLSHWSGALYLDGLDHFVKRVLKVRAYQRYMDDFTLFGDDLQTLNEHRSAICQWLLRERHLRLKIPDVLVQPTSQACTYLGYRVSRAGLAPGPKAKRRMKRRLARWDSMSTGQLERSLQSYQGMFTTL